MKNEIFDNFILKITKSARAKNLRLRVDKTGTVHLSMPKWTLKSTGIKFVTDNIEWINEQLDKIKPTKHFKNGIKIPVLGQYVTICHTPNQRGACKIQNGQLFVSGETEHLHRRVRDFIIRLAYPYIQTKAIQMAAQLGEKPTRITLKDTSTRWGSCSSTKHLNFCWKLAMAPDYVLDYIIAHEVSHLKEMNHSDKFWAVVGTLGVRRADAEIWLRKNGTDLQAWE
ncbi:MAG: M48 family metallopeptidase [Alphaproteobacteria bacterium]|nr:M48 family metallopeptidase [Alphaproteobacteria bacterium]